MASGGIDNGKAENQLVPKYYIVKMAILNQIDSHELLSGCLIPSEKQLMELYGASRITVRRAVDLLETEGYVRKVQGKGTYVTNPAGHGVPTSTGAISCGEVIRKQNHTPERVLLRKEVVPCAQECAQNLECAFGSNILAFERVYTADGVPAIYADSKINLTALPGFERFDLVNYSMMDIIREDFGFEVGKSNRALRAIVADEKLAAVFHVSAGFPLLYYDGITVGYAGGQRHPLEQFTICYRTDIIYFLPEMLG